MIEWGMVRLGASVQENAQATLDELLGTQGDQRDLPSESYKPARSDIQKMKDAYDLWTEGHYSHGDPIADPGDATSFQTEDWQRAKHALDEWNEKYGLDSDEQQAVVEYMHGLDQSKTQQEAFEHAVQWVQLTGALDRKYYNKPEEAKKLVAGALKKYEQQNWPLLYGEIVRALDDAYRHNTVSYKLWPRMVQWVKDEYNQWLWYRNPGLNRTNMSPGRLPIAHIVDVVTEGGEVLSKLRAENKIPQNFDVNKLDFKEFEDWLMEWKRENRQAESQGEIVYEYHDGWTIQKLTTPEQLQFEGDEMGHCVGGYSHQVSNGESIIYSLRDPKGMPHVTMEVEGLSALKQYGDKPIDEYNEEDGFSLRHLLNGRTDEDTGRYYPPVTQLYMHNPENWENGEQVRSTGRTAPYPFDRVRLSPEDDPRDHWQATNTVTDGYNHVKPLKGIFEVVQIQGKGNKTPKSEYQHKIKEFLDYLREKGWKFVRSDRDEDEDEEEYSGATREAQDLDEWYDNHYKTQHERYRGTQDTDAYGMPRARMRPGIGDWTELLKSCIYSCLDVYDHYQWRGHWDDLAQAVYHAWITDIQMEHPTEEQLKAEKEAFAREIERADEQIIEWEDEQWMYSMDHDSTIEDVADKIKEIAEQNGQWPQIEKEMDAEYSEVEDGVEEPFWNDAHLVEHVQETHEDLYYEASDAVREHHLKYYSEDAHKFVNYLYQLVEKKGLVAPQELPDPNERHGGLPSYAEIGEMPWKTETPVEKGIEGTLSKVADEWALLKLAVENIQIHPIDETHNIWFDEDGNERARWRPAWATNPETGKMEQTGALEDSFLDKMGRQGQGYVAYHGDRPVGSLTYVDDPAGWYMLGTAYTHPDYREQGIFNQLVAPLRESGKPIDAYVWNNPWLKNKVRGWR